VEGSYVIIGSGLAGASIRYFLKEEHSILIERAPTAGGLSQNTTFLGCNINVAGITHLRIAESTKKVLNNLFQDLGDEFKNILNNPITGTEETAGIFIRKRIVPFPVQLNVHKLSLGMRLSCMVDSIKRIFFDPSQAENFREWVTKNVGRTLAQEVILPHTFKTYQVDPALLDQRTISDKVVTPSVLESFISFFKQVHKQGKGDSTQSNVFYPLKSVSHLVKKILEKGSGDIKLSTEIKDGMIDYKNKIIILGEGKDIRYKKLFTTIPLPGFIDLLKEPPDDIVLAMNYLDFNFMAQTVLVFEGECPLKVQKLWLPSENFAAQRLLCPTIIDPDCSPEGRYVIIAETCFPRGKKHLVSHPLFQDSLVSKVLKDLEQLKMFNVNRLLGAKVFLVNPAYIIPDKHCMESRLKILNFLNRVGIVPVGYFAEWKTREIDSTIYRAWEVCCEF
jgi:protoporphyrinogen oxidase